jgi:oligopeptide/dipeptide ABC transporter ATP-binding protein
MKPHKKPILELSNLKTHFFLEEGVLKALEGITFSILPEEVLGVIGESGCGKSVTAQSIMRIVPEPGKIVEGKIYLNHNDKRIDLTSLNPKGKEIRNIRGREISMIFQEPMTSLSPLHTIGNQVVEAILLHKTTNKNEAREIAIEMLGKVGIPNPSKRIDEYPHQLSGGLRQRAMIAMALSCNPSLLIADEPTTALDVTVQAQILSLISDLQKEIGMSVMYITHDLGVIAEVSNNVAVMYLGRIVEYGNVVSIFDNPLHPYTELLLKSVPKLGKKSQEKLAAIKGTVPIPLNPPVECGFYARCPRAIEGTCTMNVPALVEVEAGHYTRCFLYSNEVESTDE